MPYSSVEVANEFLRQPGALGLLTQMQLQKLAYIANGWNWAINHNQLISDSVQAWDFGPVYPNLYNHTKFFGKQPLNRLVTNDDSEAARFFGDAFSRGYEAVAYHANLADPERAVVQHVWNRYGRLSGAQLSALTHQRGTPWFEAYTKGGKNTEISQGAIKAHYDEIARRAVAA